MVALCDGEQTIKRPCNHSAPYNHRRHRIVVDTPPYDNGHLRTRCSSLATASNSPSLSRLTSALVLDVLAGRSVQEAGIAHNVYTYNAAITACGWEGRWAEAVAVFRRMSKKGVSPDEVSRLWSVRCTACRESESPARLEAPELCTGPGIMPIGQCW